MEACCKDSRHPWFSRVCQKPNFAIGQWDMCKESAPISDQGMLSSQMKQRQGKDLKQQNIRYNMHEYIHTNSKNVFSVNRYLPVFLKGKNKKFRGISSPLSSPQIHCHQRPGPGLKNSRACNSVH